MNIFSTRTNWLREHNSLTELIEQRKVNGQPIYDLTVTNPTECSFLYPEQELLTALGSKESLHYNPHPKGLLSARQVVSEYYSTENNPLDTEQIFLTASTSEAYSYIFKLLCNAGDTVLVPQPSYPLFEYLAQLNDVELRSYFLFYDHGWHIDIDSIRQAITPRTKAIILIHPHNPTGMFIKPHEYEAIHSIASEYHLALIVDEVFKEFSFNAHQQHISTTSNATGLTFTLNGISKMFGLPQFKLGWLIVSGQHGWVKESIERLEIIADTFLSANTPVQLALPELFRAGKTVQEQIRERIGSNYCFLCSAIQSDSTVSVLSSEGGWYGILRIPATQSDEQRAIELLNQTGILVQPGYFFDFEQEGVLLVSLLVQEQFFQSTITALLEYIKTRVQ